MFFNSLHFVAFFSTMTLFAWALRQRVRARNLVLLVGSYYFYGCWDWRFLGLIALSTTVDYFCGIGLNVTEIDPTIGSRRTRRDRWILGASLTVNLGLLAFFKYFGFFADSAAALLQSLGLHAHLPTLKVVLPVGISFYTFQSVSYTVDCYRGVTRTEHDPLTFALYVAYFPQLVAGPIERPHHLIPQISQPPPMTWPKASSGFFLICNGLFKKVVIADNVSEVANAAFSNTPASALAVLLGVYAFAIQIYCDFSGYSDIARGAARILGVDLMRNFDLPYFAVNPSDFWRRWHISLSTWLRDYVYIPLGGNRSSPRRTYFNLMTTMVVGGLWHGAAWTYVLWGAYHGALLCLHRWMQPWLKTVIAPASRLGQSVWYWLRVVMFFQLTCLGWMIFRSASVMQLWAMLRALGQPVRFALGKIPQTAVLGLALATFLLLVVQLAQFLSKDHYVMARLPVPWRGAMYAAAMLVFMWFGEYGGDAFIYFQF